MLSFDLIPKMVSWLGLAAALALGLAGQGAAQAQPAYPYGGGYPSYRSNNPYGQPAGSASVQGGAPSTLLPSNTQSNLIQGGTNGTMIQANVDREAGPVNIMFLLDCSYSMKEKLGGPEMKMNAAKEVLESALARIPNDVNVGIRVFGQSYAGLEEIDCQQTTCLVPLGTHNRNSIIQRVRRIEPFGLTPLAYALRQCVEEDFRFAQGPKTIILISDGADTCGGDPCAFITAMGRYGIRLKVDIVGLAMGRDRKGRDQLNCVAQQSGGKYFDANTSGELIESIAHSVDKAISGRVLPSSKPVKNAETKTDTETIPPQTPAGSATTSPQSPATTPVLPPGPPAGSAKTPGH